MSYHRRVSFAVYLLILLSLLAVTLPAIGAPSFAASEISLAGIVQASFPNSIQFNINAQSDSSITDLRLHYIVEKQNYAAVVSEAQPVFQPSKSVSTGWAWDMRKSALPVGASLEYWWTAADSSGKTAETQRNTYTFSDERYKWQSITTEPVTIYWYKGSASFANTLMAAAQKGLKKIGNDTGAISQGKVKLFIYASSQDLQGAHLFAPQWEGGVHFTGYGIIAIGIAPDELSWGERAVPHELTHWVIGQVTFNNYGAGLPVWLDEGLATYGEGQLLSDYQSALNSAVKSNRLFSVKSLSSPFSAVPVEAYISYGQSNSIVTFMIQKFGKDKMIQLLNVFKEGSGYDEALQQVYGFDQDGLDKLWRESLDIKTGMNKSGSVILVSR